MTLIISISDFAAASPAAIAAMTLLVFAMTPGKSPQ